MYIILLIVILYTVVGFCPRLWDGVRGILFGWVMSVGIVAGYIVLDPFSFRVNYAHH